MSRPILSAERCAKEKSLLPRDADNTIGDKLRLIYMPDVCDQAALVPGLVAALGKIGDFAPGNGDVCEIIARICREALRPVYDFERENNEAVQGLIPREPFYPDGVTWTVRDGAP